MCERADVCVRARARVRACVRACVRVCIHAHLDINTKLANGRTMSSQRMTGTQPSKIASYILTDHSSQPVGARHFCHMSMHARMHARAHTHTHTHIHTHTSPRLLERDRAASSAIRRGVSFMDVVMNRCAPAGARQSCERSISAWYVSGLVSSVTSQPPRLRKCFTMYCRTPSE